jgi:gamma-glutamylcyclotransferase (GGCT)/AIG2-like uncharacterized protein YtfP
MMHKVFVYGSLRKYGVLHDYLISSQFLGEKKTAKGFTLFSLGPFPAMVPSGEGVITGEVYLVNEMILSILDQVEGHPEFYVRTQILMEDGEQVEAYLLPAEPISCKIVQSGDWMDYLTS